MLPNSRKACLKSSLALVIYALSLILIQYIFSLDLTEDELPTVFKGIKMKDIGFIKTYDSSYRPLAFKVNKIFDHFLAKLAYLTGCFCQQTLFTLMFWITLRQYREEKALEEANRAEASSMAVGSSGQPRTSFHRKMSLASGVVPELNTTFANFSKELRKLFVKYWIWVVAIMLMVMSLRGDSVVIYRIIYMLLFLSFIFIFQVKNKVICLDKSYKISPLRF